MDSYDSVLSNTGKTHQKFRYSLSVVVHINVFDYLNHFDFYKDLNIFYKNNYNHDFPKINVILLCENNDFLNQ